MAGPTEEAGRVAGGIVEALKGQPLSLALVVMNIGLLVYLFYSGHQTLVQRNEYVARTQKILSSCIPVEDFERLQRSLRGGQP